MSEDERRNGHKNKGKMKSVEEEEEEEEYKPEELLILLSQNMRIAKKTRNPVTVFTNESANRSINPLPPKKRVTVRGTRISAEIPSSIAVQVNQKKPQSSILAQGSKKIAKGKNKGVVIEEEVLPKRLRPSYDDLEVLKKGDIVDSDFDATTDEYTDESDEDYIP